MGNQSDEIRVHARITGLVQGVGYRYFAYTTARRLNLTGWVRNLADGSVEIEAQGEHDAVTRFLSQLRRGPRWAQVSNLDTTPIKPRHDETADEFRVEADHRAQNADQPSHTSHITQTTAHGAV
jgi:acylphosphatase